MAEFSDQDIIDLISSEQGGDVGDYGSPEGRGAPGTSETVSAEPLGSGVPTFGTVGTAGTPTEESIAAQLTEDDSFRRLSGATTSQDKFFETYMKNGVIDWNAVEKDAQEMRAKFPQGGFLDNLIAPVLLGVMSMGFASVIAPMLAAVPGVSTAAAGSMANTLASTALNGVLTGKVDLGSLASSLISSNVTIPLTNQIISQIEGGMAQITNNPDFQFSKEQNKVLLGSIGSALSTAIKGGTGEQDLKNLVAGAVNAEMNNLGFDPGLSKAAGTYISTGDIGSAITAGVTKAIGAPSPAPAPSPAAAPTPAPAPGGVEIDPLTGEPIAAPAPAPTPAEAPVAAPAPSPVEAPAAAPTPAEAPAPAPAPSVVVSAPAISGTDQALLDLISQAPAPAPAPVAAPTPAPSPPTTGAAPVAAPAPEPAPAPSPAPAAEPAPAPAVDPTLAARFETTGAAEDLSGADLIGLVDRDLAGTAATTGVGAPPPPPAVSPAPPPPQEKSDLANVVITANTISDLTGIDLLDAVGLIDPNAVSQLANTVITSELPTNVAITSGAENAGQVVVSGNAITDIGGTDLIDTSGVAAGDLGTAGAGVDTGAGNVTIGGGTTNVGDVSNAGQVTIAGTNVTDLTGADLIDLTTGGVDTGAVTDLGNVTITAGGGAAGDASNAGQVVVTGGGATNVSDQDLIDFTGLVDSGAISDLANTTITTGLGDNNASQVTITGTAANNVGSDLIDSDVGDGNIVSGGTGTVVISGAGDNNAASNVGNVIIDTTTTGNVTLGDGSTTNVSNVGNVSTDLFTYVPPKRRPPSVAELVTMRQYPTTGVTQGLAPRAPGEIESEVTGKKRRNVWNEASLRLKDALGL